MQNLKDKYVTNKLVSFFPEGATYQEGYIRDVDELGWTYEVTAADFRSNCGIHFRSHSMNFSFKIIKE